MAIATIIDETTGREETLTRHAWNLCPRVVGYKTVCGYYESRCELFMFACNVADMIPENCVWVDGATGEVLSFWDLCDDESELFEEEE